MFTEKKNQYFGYFCLKKICFSFLLHKNEIGKFVGEPHSSSKFDMLLLLLIKLQCVCVHD